MQFANKYETTPFIEMHLPINMKPLIENQHQTIANQHILFYEFPKNDN